MRTPATYHPYVPGVVRNAHSEFAVAIVAYADDVDGRARVPSAGNVVAVRRTIHPVSPLARAGNHTELYDAPAVRHTTVPPRAALNAAVTFPPGATVTLHPRPGYGSCDAGMLRGSSGAMTDDVDVDTVVVAEPRTPSAVALICAVPVVKPVTRPDDETEATDVVPLVQLNDLPVSALPAASLATADAWVVPPT